MKLLFKQRFFSWFDSYDIYDEAGNTLFVVKGELAWGHLLRIYDANGNEIGCIKEKILTWLPKFEMYIGDCYNVLFSNIFLHPNMRASFLIFNFAVLGISAFMIEVFCPILGMKSYFGCTNSSCVIFTFSNQRASDF